MTIGGASVTATTSNDFVPAGGWMAFAVGSSAYLAGIETAGATTLNLSGGSGLPTGACCAAGGAGSGSNASVGSTGSAVPGSATLGGMSVSGTLTAMPGTSNGLKIDGSAVTQPISAASLPLPTGAATAAGQPTVAGSGSTTSGQTGNLDMAAVTSSSPAYTNGQTNALSLTTAGALRVDGSAVTQPVSAASLPLPSGAATAANQTSWQGAAGSAAPSNASYAGAREQNAEPTPTSNGNLTGLAVGLEGKLITLPFANKENMVRGSASQTGTSATTLIAAQGSGVKIYVTGVQCKNSGSTTTIVTLNDTETTGSGTVLIVPTLGGDNEVFRPRSPWPPTRLSPSPRRPRRRPSIATRRAILSSPSFSRSSGSLLALPRQPSLGVGSPSATCPMAHDKGDGCPQALGDAQVIFPDLLTTAPPQARLLRRR